MEISQVTSRGARA